MHDSDSFSDSQELSELLRLSHAVGADPDWVQGGGGNTSVKSSDGRSMWVKASGAALKEMTATRGWAKLDLPAVCALLDEPGLAARPAAEREALVLERLRATVREPSGARPSVESSLHALLDRVVIHSHPIQLTAFLCANGSRTGWRALLGELAAEALYVPYVDPGFTLAATLRAELAAFERASGRQPAIVLLENHGLFVAAASVDDCLRRHEQVAALGRRWAGGKRVNPLRFTALPPDERSGDAEYPICANDLASPTRGASVTRSGSGAITSVRGALLRGGARPLLVRRDDSPTAMALLREPVLVQQLCEGAFTPDQVVYCRTVPLLLDGLDDAGRADTDAATRWSAAVVDYRRRYQLDPKVVVVPGLGIFHAGSDLAELRVVAETHRLAMTVLLTAGRSGGPRLLDRRQARFIEEWEVEKFRAALVGGGDRPLLGCIALLIGGGELAEARERLLAGGATVFAAHEHGAGVVQEIVDGIGGLDLVLLGDEGMGSVPLLALANAAIGAQGVMGVVQASDAADPTHWVVADALRPLVPRCWLALLSGPPEALGNAAALGEVLAHVRKTEPTTG